MRRERRATPESVTKLERKRVSHQHQMSVLLQKYCMVYDSGRHALLHLGRAETLAWNCLEHCKRNYSPRVGDGFFG